MLITFRNHIINKQFLITGKNGNILIFLMAACQFNHIFNLTASSQSGSAGVFKSVDDD